MGFVAENFAIGYYEPVVDRDRGWAVTIGFPDREFALSIVLYNIDDLDKIFLRDEDGSIISERDDGPSALSAITATVTSRPATKEEIEQNPGLETIAIYKFYGSTRGKAATSCVPGYDWEQSKAIYGEALMAQEEGRKKKFPQTANIILKTFE